MAVRERKSPVARLFTDNSLCYHPVKQRFAAQFLMFANEVVQRSVQELRIESTTEMVELNLWRSIRFTK